MSASVFRTPFFWLFFSVISLLGFIYTFRFFPVAFPIVNIEITADRNQAIALAEKISQQFDLGPSNPSTAISFDTDSRTQTFVELAGGGQSTFINMIKTKLYLPYKWHVRRFREFETNETHIYLTPEGELYGFKELISETLIFPSISRDEALKHVSTILKDVMHIDMQAYNLIEDAKNVQQNGRLDRTFVFERSDISLHEGRYRIKAKICGNKLTHIKQYIKIPQSFTLRYKEMRSANTSIASAASVFAFIFYLLLCSLFGIFILMRMQRIIWRAPILWASLIALLDFLNTLNRLPLMWMHYKTETAKYGFLLAVIVNALSSFVMMFITTALVLIAAESLTRKAFGKQIRLWESWRPQIANSYTLLGYTIGGYLMIGIDMAFLVTFYYLSTTYFHWWVPLSQLANPNVLADYFPWLSSIAKSLQAGFVEEAQFRAIPLACAALLGERYGKKRFWIFAVFILQAFVFGAAHANYASQPAYARLLELILPSFIFAGLYLRFGLLVPVIMHYAYDVFWFALPIFISQAPGIWVNQVTVLFFTFIPLFVILYRRYQQGAWEPLHADAYNATWQPEKTPILSETIVQKELPFICNTWQKRILIACALLGSVLLIYTMRKTTDAPPLKISRAEAIDIAQKALEEKGISTKKFQVYAQLKSNLDKKNDQYREHRYIWQNFPHTVYAQLLGSFLKPPHWLVRFITFSGTATERAESYEVIVGPKNSDNPSYQALEIQHKIAESVPGEQLDKKSARAIAYEILSREGISLTDMQEVAAVPKQLPERIDWTFSFTYKNGTPMQDRRIVIKLIGDRLGHIDHYMHIPELWKRAEKKKLAEADALQTLCNLLIRILCLAGLCIALIFWAYKKIQAKTCIRFFIIFAFFYGCRLLLNWPQLVSQFNTTEPFANQFFKIYSMLSLQFLLQTLIFASMLSLIVHLRQKYFCKDIYNLYLVGICAGLIICGTWSLLSFMQPSIEPLWCYYASLATERYNFGYINAQLLKYLQYVSIFGFGAIMLNFISNYGTRYRIITLLLCIISGICFAGFETINTPLYWIISGTIFGSVLYILWYGIIRFCNETIPTIVATCFSCAIIQQMIYNCIPDILFAGTISIIGIFICGHLLSIYRRVHHV